MNPCEPVLAATDGEMSTVSIYSALGHCLDFLPPLVPQPQQNPYSSPLKLCLWCNSPGLRWDFLLHPWCHTLRDSKIVVISGRKICQNGSSLCPRVLCLEHTNTPLQGAPHLLFQLLRNKNRGSHVREQYFLHCFLQDLDVKFKSLTAISKGNIYKPELVSLQDSCAFSSFCFKKYFIWMTLFLK